MLRGMRRSDAVRGVLAGLAAIFLCMQIFAPGGFMPVRTAHGVMVTLCTGQGAVNIRVDRDRAPHKSGDEQHRQDGQQHCPFAGGMAPTLAAPAFADATLQAWTRADGPIAFAVKTGWIARLAAPPPPANAPPVLNG